jgi:hypothetical protein
MMYTKIRVHDHVLTWMRECIRRSREARLYWKRSNLRLIRVAGEAVPTWRLATAAMVRVPMPAVYACIIPLAVLRPVECMHVFLCECICVSVWACAYVCTRKYTFARVYLVQSQKKVRKHLGIHMHTYIHTCMHAQNMMVQPWKRQIHASHDPTSCTEYTSCTKCWHADTHYALSIDMPILIMH